MRTVPLERRVGRRGKWENDMDDEKELIVLEEAIKRLPDGDMVHTFRQNGQLLIGADHERARLIDAMRNAPEIEITGPQAQAMGHGLAIRDDYGWLFIETANAAVSGRRESD